MNTKPCSSQAIFNANRDKEYTLIATTILEVVLTDNRLNAQSAKLWQLLFNKARYNPKLDIKISYSYLAKTLNKSVRTIARYVETLQTEGYLLVTHNFDKSGAQRPNTISVRIPESLMAKVNNKKDRKNKQYSVNNSSSLESSHENTIPFEKHRQKTSPPQHDLPFPTNHVLHETMHSDTKSETTETGSSVLPFTSPSISTSTPQPVKCIPCDQPQPQIQDTGSSEKAILLLDRAQRTSSKQLNSSIDKNDRGEGDNTVIQKERNNKEINNNNNVVNGDEFEKITQLKQEIIELEQRLAEGNKTFATIKDHTLLYEHIKKNAQLSASLHLANIALERLQKNKTHTQTAQKMNSELISNPHFLLQKPGQRTLSTSTFKRLTQTLELYGYQGIALNQLTNEIIFEARFGSLVYSNQTKTNLSVDNAIHIALKLVREKRWSTPTLLKNHLSDSLSGT